MIELDATLAILMLEALIVLIGLVLLFIVMNANKKNKEHAAADSLIKKVNKSSAERNENLTDVLTNIRAIDLEMQQQVMQDISAQERQLYQEIVRLFLQKDVSTLSKIDNCIKGLSEPYFKLIQTQSGAGDSAVSSDDISSAQQTISKLQTTCKRLSDQLNTALSSVDEISSEYSRIFNGTKNEEELQKSCKKMLHLYRQAQQQLLDRSSEKG